jgi:hypothetical protein
MSCSIIPKCIICLEKCVIPVEITCFGCATIQTKPSCFSFQRVCFVCATMYMELNKPYHKRSTTKRCLICPAECNPRALSEKTWYRKDFMLMRMDTSIDVHCPCEKCSFTGSHIDVEKHYTGDCPYTITSCLCNTYVSRCDMISHKKQCSFYRECSKCSEFLLVTEYERHLQDIHNMIVCLVCKDITSLDIADHLEQECNFRLVHCVHCRKYIRSKELHQHYVEHAVEIRYNLGLMYNVIDKEQAKLLRVNNDLQKLQTD